MSDNLAVTIRLLVFAAGIATYPIFFTGCQSQGATDAGARQRQVQDCILSGGHARLGPGDTILCERRFQ